MKGDKIILVIGAIVIAIAVAIFLFRRQLGLAAGVKTASAARDFANASSPAEVDRLRAELDTANEAGLLEREQFLTLFLASEKAGFREDLAMRGAAGKIAAAEFTAATQNVTDSITIRSIYLQLLARSGDATRPLPTTGAIVIVNEVATFFDDFEL